MTAPSPEIKNAHAKKRKRAWGKVARGEKSQPVADRPGDSQRGFIEGVRCRDIKEQGQYRRHQEGGRQRRESRFHRRGEDRLVARFSRRG